MPLLHRALLIAAVSISGAACSSTSSSSQPPSTVEHATTAAQAGQNGEPRPFGLAAEDGPYRLDVAELSGRGGQAIMLSITKDGEALNQIESEYMHVIAIGDDLSYVMHETLSEWSSWMNVDDIGETRVVVSFTDEGSEVVLGADVNVTEGSDFSGAVSNSTQTDLVDASGVMVKRDGWTFEVIGSRTQEPRYDYGAWLTIIREADLAVSFQSLDQVGDGIYSFDPVLGGAGEYLAVLEVAGAPTFSFFVAVDADGDFIERPENELVSAVKSFVAAIDKTDAGVVLDMMSTRCRSLLPPSLAGELSPLVDPTTRVWPTSIVADMTGDDASVRYVTIEGDYTPGETPARQRHVDDWVFEADTWRRDTCEAGYFDW